MIQKRLISVVTFALIISCSNAQNEFQKELIGGPCEGCEAVFEYETPLQSIDTLPNFEAGIEPIYVSGTVYEPDGKTPAGDVILYVYHTNPKGIYPSKADSKGWEKRHGYIRTWLKTDENGQYAFYTLKPASYPNTSVNAHIHATILEPNGKYYYISDFLFADDPNLREPSQPRGGSGILTFENSGDIPTAKRDITLGRNVPGY